MGGGGREVKGEGEGTRRGGGGGGKGGRGRAWRGGEAGPSQGDGWGWEGGWPEGKGRGKGRGRGGDAGREGEGTGRAGWRGVVRVWGEEECVGLPATAACRDGSQRVEGGRLLQQHLGLVLDAGKEVTVGGAALDGEEAGEGQEGVVGALQELAEGVALARKGDNQPGCLQGEVVNVQDDCTQAVKLAGKDVALGCLVDVGAAGDEAGEVDTVEGGLAAFVV